MAGFTPTSLFQSCSTESAQSTADSPKSNRYYDLKSYFEKETERLKEAKVEVLKTVELNNTVEKKEASPIDFDNELLIFRESHINKVSWWGKYAGDTTYYKNDQIKRITYTSIDKELKTKNIRISFSPNGNIDSLFILNATDNPTISTHQELIYIPNTKYHIQSQEKVFLSKDRIVKIEGVFSQ